MKKLPKGNLKEFLARFIIESDAIESINDNPDLVKTQLNKNSTKGHVGALLLVEDMARKKEKVLTEGMVREVQRLITSEQHTKEGGPFIPLEYIGSYRTVGVRVGGRIAPPPTSVPALMMNWAARVETWQKNSYQQNITNLLKIARFHFEYEHIHPFADGNGRSGRAVVYYLMRYCELEPFIFTAADRFDTYYRCFQDPEAMCQYFEKNWQDETKLYK